MSDDNGGPFRPFQQPRATAWGLVLATGFALFMITLGFAVTAAVTGIALVFIGDFSLSLANVLGIALVWYILDLGIAQRIRAIHDDS